MSITGIPGSAGELDILIVFETGTLPSSQINIFPDNGAVTVGHPVYTKE